MNLICLILEEFDIDRTLPLLNWDAKNYYEMIFWDELSCEQLHEPSMTRNLNEDELKSLEFSLLQTPDLYCHTQCVERSGEL